MGAAVVSLFTESASRALKEDGYVVMHGAVDQDTIDALTTHLHWLSDRVTDQPWTSTSSSSLGQYLRKNPAVRKRLCHQAKVPRWLQHFVTQPDVLTAVHSVLGPDLQLLRDIDLDIVPPSEGHREAIWHQDQFYVRNGHESIVAFLPLHDMGLREGLLHVMPGSHGLGALPHNNLVLGDRRFPCGIFEREVRLVPIQRGDLILMNCQLVQSQGPNLSPAVRWGIRARFLPPHAKMDPRHNDALSLVQS